MLLLLAVYNDNNHFISRASFKTQELLRDLTKARAGYSEIQNKHKRQPNTGRHQQKTTIMRKKDNSQWIEEWKKLLKFFQGEFWHLNILFPHVT